MDTCYKRRGFSLVELLVAISIVGMLMSLLLPAIQGAREAARRLECKHNLKQIGLAWHAHHGVVHYFPSGGWGDEWIGDADRGFGAGQPGGWTYSMLPFVDQGNLFDLPTDGKPDLITVSQMSRGAILCESPLALLHCVSRRRPVTYPADSFADPENGFSHNADRVPRVAKSDYAANMGEHDRAWMPPANPTDAFAGRGFTVNPDWNGVAYQRSEVGINNVTDGLSHTYMVAEKNVPRHAYGTNRYPNDDAPAYAGKDALVTSQWPPVHDRQAGVSMGSAHPVGFSTVFCDGSVRHVSYSIDHTIHRALSTRYGSETVSPP